MNNFRSTKLIFSIWTLIGLLSSCSSNGPGSSGSQAIPVAMQTISNSILTQSSDFVGILQALKRVNLASQVDGRVQAIYVKDGQTVINGQKILNLVPFKQQQQFNQAKAQLGQSQADFRQSQLQLEAAQAQFDKTTYAISQRLANVAQAQAQLDSQEINITKAQSDLKLAQKNYQRSKFLVEQGAISQQDLDNKIDELSSTQSAVKSALKTRDAYKEALKASKESLNAAYSDNKIADKQILEAKANIIYKKQATIASLGNMGAVGQDLNYNSIVAPISGTVSDISAKKVGDILKNGETFTSIVDNSILELSLNIPVEKKEQLKLGLPVEIINADGSSGVVGKITFISPSVTQDSQTILAKATFINNGHLRDSQYVRTRIIWNQRTGILIPTSVVTNIGANNFVFIAQKRRNSEGKDLEVAEQRLVNLGSIQGQDYQVLSGLNAGEELIVSRTQILSNGMPVISLDALKQTPKP